VHKTQAKHRVGGQSQVVMGERFYELQGRRLRTL